MRAFGCCAASNHPPFLLLPPPLLLSRTLPCLASCLHLLQPANGSLQPSPPLPSPVHATKKSRPHPPSLVPCCHSPTGRPVTLPHWPSVPGDELPDPAGACQKDSARCERAVDVALEYVCSTTVYDPGLVVNDGPVVFARDPQEMQTASGLLENPRNETILQIVGTGREAHVSVENQELPRLPAARAEMNNDLAEVASLGSENAKDRGSRDGRTAAVRRFREQGRKHSSKSANEKPKGPDFDQAKGDEKFMREALLEAEKAELAGEVPVGAVMVSRGTVIARAHNRVEAEGDPTAHAEMLCIRKAAQQLGGWRLLEATIYVTLEPCPMCAGAILQARVGCVVWGAQNSLLGADGSWVSLFPRTEEEASSKDSNSEVTWLHKPDEVAVKAPSHPFHPNIKVRQRVLSEECSGVMKRFFQTRREDKAAAKLSVNNWSISQFPAITFLMIRTLIKTLKLF